MEAGIVTVEGSASTVREGDVVVTKVLVVSLGRSVAIEVLVGRIARVVAASATVAWSV